MSHDNEFDNETVPRVEKDVVYEEENPVLYEVRDRIAYLTLNRPKFLTAKTVRCCMPWMMLSTGLPGTMMSRSLF